MLTLIVVDDPTGKEHFGSMVAGPTAIAVLRQALGLPRTYDTAEARGISDTPELVPASFNTEELPWAAPAVQDAPGARRPGAASTTREGARGR